MDRTEQVKICKTCINKKFDFSQGVVCSLTDLPPDFEASCSSYILDEKIMEEQFKKEVDEQYAKKGKKKTMVVFATLIFFSVFVLVFSFFTFRPLTSSELMKSAIRLVLEIGLYYLVFTGTSWAKTCLTVLFGVAIAQGLRSIFSTIDQSYLILIILIPIILYGYAIYFFNADKDFLRYFKYRRENS